MASNPGSAPRPAPTIRDLISYRIGRTANAMSRGAALRYAGLGVTLQEWRTIALLACDAPQSLNRLARAAGLDKAQMSRAVSALVARGFIDRSGTPGRRSELVLSRSGRTLYDDLIAAARERDAAFRACLSEEELLVLERALGKLEAVAHALARAAQPADTPDGPPETVDVINSKA